MLAPSRKFMIIGIIMALSHVFIPSSKVMTALYLIPKMAKSETVDTLSRFPVTIHVEILPVVLLVRHKTSIQVLPSFLLLITKRVLNVLI